MKIKLNCPVCRAKNELHLLSLHCRRCQEDLSLLYRTKAYSYKYRFYLLQVLADRSNPRRQAFAQAAVRLDASVPKASLPIVKELLPVSGLTEEE